MALIVGMHFATLFLMIQYFQQVLELTPLLAGFAYMPLTIAVFIVTHFMPRLIDKFGLRALIVAGCILVAVSLVSFSMLDKTSGYWSDVLLPLLIHSVAIALVFTPGSIIIMDGVEDNQAGVMSGVLQMAQQIGGAIGIAAILTIYTAYLKPGIFHSGLGNAFKIAAIVCDFASLIAFLTISSKKKL